MPLVRAEVRNEYALGGPELYRETNKEDPKEVLEGVAVAGLVGVLRQLGDLAEFAAEVFHGLQEEVMITSSRSRELMARAQRIETALSPLEKALLAQRSHLHFAYTAGSNWHARIRCEQNHFIYSDVPQFIMDSYDDSRGPPCLHLLDKFDPGGPGSCLKRYSDPTFFKRASVASGEASASRISKDKKGRKIKKRRSWTRSREVSRDASFSYNSGRMQFTQKNADGHSSSFRTASTYDWKRSDLDEQKNLNLRNGSGNIEGDFYPINSMQPQEQESRESISSSVMRRESDFLDYNFLEGKIADGYDDIQIYPSQEQANCSSSSVTWDEKNETLEPTARDSDNDGMTQDTDHNRHLESFSPDLNLETIDHKAVSFETVDKMDIQPCDEAVPAPESGDAHLDDIESETDQFMDALNTIESECETDTDCTKRQETENYYKLEEDNGIDEGVCDVTRHNLESQSSSEYNVFADNSLINGSCGHDPILSSPKSLHATNSNGEAEKGVVNSNGEAEKGVVNSNGEAEKDVVNSVPLVDKDSQSSPRAGDSSTPVSPQNVDSHEENDSTDAKNNVEAVSSPILSNFKDDKPGMPITDATRNVPESSDVTLVRFWTNGARSTPVSPHSVDSHEENDSTDAKNYVEAVSSPILSNFEDDRPGMPITDATRNVPESSNVTSVRFWTNGGLLGLQPSKPPDCSILNAPPSQDPVYKKGGEISSSIQYPTLSDKDARQPDQKEHFKHIEEDCEYQEIVTPFRKTSWKISPADLDIKFGKLGDPVHLNNANITGSSVTAHGSLLTVNPAFQSDDRKDQENSKVSSRMFELSNKLLSTGSNKKLLPSGDQNTNAFEQKNRRTVPHRTFSGRSKDPFGGVSPILSPSASPPLVHMKLSFEPIDGFESSKLKLKFPDRNTNGETAGDVFPSFQLVPEVSITQHNVPSDSDAETFYRSSPSSDDDSHSNQSESNSEQWETSESPTSKDRDLYDALRRISVTEAVTTVPENGTTKKNYEGNNIHANYRLQFPIVENGLQNSASSRSFDLQSLGTVNDSFRKEPRNDIISPKGLVEPQFMPTPAPPPLPPVQWQVGTEKSEAVPEGSRYALGLTHSTSMISQPKPAPFNEDHIVTKTIQRSKSIPHILNGQRETNLGKSMDEKEDFLHQIRTKSFNLRPTVTTKPTVLSGGAANVQVTAILEKANAIRQAVGSDGEDDGNWSET